MFHVYSKLQSVTNVQIWKFIPGWLSIKCLVFSIWDEIEFSSVRQLPSERYFYHKFKGDFCSTEVSHEIFAQFARYPVYLHQFCVTSLDRGIFSDFFLLLGCVPDTIEIFEKQCVHKKIACHCFFFLPSVQEQTLDR